jgi:biotin operon repressor
MKQDKINFEDSKKVLIEKLQGTDNTDLMNKYNFRNKNIMYSAFMGTLYSVARSFPNEIISLIEKLTIENVVERKEAPIIRNKKKIIVLERLLEGNSLESVAAELKISLSKVRVLFFESIEEIKKSGVKIKETKLKKIIYKHKKDIINYKKTIC